MLGGKDFQEMIFSELKRCSSADCIRDEIAKKNSLGQKFGQQQCNHVERRNPGSEKYQSVLLELEVKVENNESEMRKLETTAK